MASTWMLPSLLIALLLVMGLGGAYTQILEPYVGFRLYMGGALLSALSAIGLGAAAAIASALGRGWRSSAVKGAALPLLATLVIVGPQLSSPTPIMNDISTDLENPPVFKPDVAAGSETTTASEALRELQTASYPDIGPIQTEESPAMAFGRALSVARQMEDWEITRIDQARNMFEAIATSALFHFKDDVVIRVRPEGSGARLDIRSRSRVGRGDMGANAARIRAFQERFTSAASAS